MVAVFSQEDEQVERLRSLAQLGKIIRKDSRCHKVFLRES
jgi:hypothetical protein